MASHRIPFESMSAAERSRLLAEIDQLRHLLRDRHRHADLAGNTSAIARVRELVAQLAPSPRAVLLRGEEGAGKARTARALHAASGRPTDSFVTITCRALIDSDVEAQLFGTTGGSAGQATVGGVARATGGTLYFDEVADLGPRGQQRVLELARGPVHESRDAAEPRPGIRVVAATTRDLEGEADSRRFDGELARYLMELTIRVPPLRERKADVPVLTELFVEQFAREHGRAVSRVSSRALDMLVNYDWPGNVTELRRTIQRAVVMTSGPIIHHHHLPPEVQEAGDSGDAAHLGLTDALEAYEKELLRDALRKARGVRSQAARLLMTSERVFSYRLRKHRIDARGFRAS